MHAYHSNPQLKAQFIRLLRWHQEQDKIVQGSYQDTDEAGAHFTVNGWSFASFGAGCAVGCSIESLRIIQGKAGADYQDHAAYEELIGVPRVLARLEDGIFERLPIEEAKQWPIQFAESIPVGADLARVWPRFAVWLMDDAEFGVIRFARNDRQRAAIQDVADAYRRVLEGQEVTRTEWRQYAADAADAADAAAAAAYAAYAAAYAADAAADAAYAAAAAAAYAYAADAADADADARITVRRAQATKLLELIRACEEIKPAAA